MKVKKKMVPKTKHHEHGSPNKGKKKVWILNDLRKMHKTFTESLRKYHEPFENTVELLVFE